MQDDDAPTYRVLSGLKSPVVILSRRWMEGYVDIWNTDKKKRVGKIVLPKDESMYQVLETALSYDDALVAVGGKSYISIWQTGTAKKVAVLPVNGKMAFSTSQTELAVVTESTLRFYTEK